MSHETKIRCLVTLAAGVLLSTTLGFGIAGAASGSPARTHERSAGRSIATARPLSHTINPAGTYLYTDSIVGSPLDMVIESDNSVTVTVGEVDCTGIWTQSDNTMAMSWLNCNGYNYVMTATIGKKGLSSVKKPGSVFLSIVPGDAGTASYSGTWYAVKS